MILMERHDASAVEWRHEQSMNKIKALKSHGVDLQWCTIKAPQGPSAILDNTAGETVCQTSRAGTGGRAA